MLVDYISDLNYTLIQQGCIKLISIYNVSNTFCWICSKNP